MKRNILILGVSLFFTFIACKNSTLNKQITIYDTNKCVNDTTLNNGTKIEYRLSEKDSLCFMKIVTDGGIKSDLDSFYYDKNECRMIPKLLYSTNNELFLLSGSGFNYRLLFRYDYDSKTITKDKTQFDIFESDSSNVSYYPYVKNNTLCVLAIDTLNKVKKIKTKTQLGENKIKGISIMKNQLIITISNNQKINIDL